VHSAACTGDAGAAGVVTTGETGSVAVPAGPAGWVVHPATDTKAIAMTRSVSTLGSIQSSWLPDPINKT